VKHSTRSKTLKMQDGTPQIKLLRPVSTYTKLTYVNNPYIHI